ncbi:RUN and FYVE domain-containing protein 2-like [Hydra vulgaris]|uniref:RUN and FYVE domain-containing protein 2-like n=1 Tax=Hydra vulgaris TaxID=6087 RepID=A0ABM4BWG8_HYDVU
MADEDYDSIVVTDTGGISKKAGSFSSWPTELSERKWQIERSNLLNIAKICVKTLIESSLSAKTGRVLTDDFSPLLHFFVIIEHILRHGMKAKRSLLGGRKEFISVLEILENKIPLLQDILLNIKNLSNVKTNLGRTRAWIRFALMQKVFAEQLSRIVEERPILSEWYEDYSMILSDEMLVISGLLVGLNVIDCNFDLKSTDLDTQNSVIDISIYLRDGNYLEKSVDKNGLDATEGPKLDVILDQKAYLEQINKTLNDSNTILKQQVKDFIERETVISKEVDLLKNQLLASIAERDKYKYDYEKLLLDHNQTIKTVTSDFDVERETHQQSRAGLNEMYLKVQADLDRVTLEKKELEIMMDDHIAMNKEKMLAMELLEKDINDKQEIITSLRRQLEDIKKINLEMHKKWQASETLLKKNESEYASLEIKLANSISQVKELEKNLAETEQLKKQEEEKALNNNAKFQNERQILQTDLKIEREWRIGLQSEIENNIKKLQKLEYELNQLTETVKENESMKKKLLESEKTCADLETALEEMGKKLNMSHSQVDEMRELQIAMKDKLWQEDKDANECQLCIQQFSLSKRKHHCRNCGGIFCHSCSDNTLALKSSAKPVRVCDTCYEALLSRCTPKPN